MSIPPLKITCSCNMFNKIISKCTVSQCMVNFHHLELCHGVKNQCLLVNIIPIIKSGWPLKKNNFFEKRT